MESFAKGSIQMDGNFEEYAHVFQIADKDSIEEGKRFWRQKFWQIFPSCCASLLAIPFGIMLGWPSPSYPYLIQDSAVIQITLSQSAMIAGFLMLGVTFATPFSSKYHLGPKYGIWIGIILIIIGWVLMLYSKDIFWLLGSRLVVGLGHGYGLGQIKSYINDMCNPKLALTLIKQLNLYVFFGVTIAFITGLFLDFRNFSYVPVIISVFILLVTLFLPCTPKELIKKNKTDSAVVLLNYLRGKKDHTNEIKKIQTELLDSGNGFLLPIMRNQHLRKLFFKFVFLVFLQQFIGGPTTIIYCQLIFTRSGCPYPEYCAVLYSIVFFTSNIYGIFYAPNLNRKFVLILSCISCCIMLGIQVLILHFEVNQKFWPYTSLVVLILFITFYCVGLGNIPVTYIPVWFPKQYKLGMTNLFIMEFSMMALIATKIFQVFITAFSLYAGFCMFIVVDFICLIFVIIFVQNNPEADDNHMKSNTVYFWNSSNTHKEKNLFTS